MGSVQGGKNAHLHINPSPTHGLESKEERWSGWLPEETEEQMFLGNYRTSHLNQRTRNWGRWKRRVSKEERKYLNKVVITSTSSICLDSRLCFAFVHFLFFFLSRKVWLFHPCTIHAFQIFSNRVHCTRTIHGTHKHFIHKKNIKNESHNTIHTFKNYFTTVFSVFNKISYIQTDPWCTIPTQMTALMNE